MFRLAPNCTVGCLGLSAKVVWLLFCVWDLCVVISEPFFQSLSGTPPSTLPHTINMWLVQNVCALVQILKCRFESRYTTTTTMATYTSQIVQRTQSTPHHREITWVWGFYRVFVHIYDHCRSPHVCVNAMMMCASVYLCSCSLVPCRQSHDNLLAHWHISDVRLGGLQFVRSFNDRWYENSRATNKQKSTAQPLEKKTHTPYWNSHRTDTPTQWVANIISLFCVCV